MENNQELEPGDVPPRDQAANENDSDTHDADNAAWNQAIEGLGTEEELDEPAEDLSPQMQSKLKRLEDAVWHAPQGKGTRVVAVIILAAIALSLITMVVMAIVSAI